VIGDVVREQSDLARSRDVTLSVHMNEKSISFLFDPDLLKSAISNLVQNAIEASVPGQTVEMRAENRDEAAMIFVSDHGEGIQPQHLENIFNPFFTTKPHGTGLGLAIVSKIIDEHRGRINVFSEPGAGTTFEVRLPKGEQI
jgi:signal transduction histidine kinase